MKTVMIVDDSRIMRNIVKKTFEMLKKQVDFIEASDGEDAMELLLENKVNLILLDWNMPRLSGIDFLKQVRAMEDYREIPIIMVTSEASKLGFIEAVKAGVTGYITKPFTEKTFLDKLAGISL